MEELTQWNTVQQTDWRTNSVEYRTANRLATNRTEREHGMDSITRSCCRGTVPGTR
uniref:Uncharacterized protein n=1 Tax=Arundo donax TaxID=35708 RepID=A0A0A9FM05_ARUDO